MKRKFRPAKKGILYFIRRYFVSLLIVSVLVIFISPFTHRKPTIACANTISCSKSLSFKVENNAIGIFDNKKVIPPHIELLSPNSVFNVLGVASSSGEKHIDIDLTKQMLYAYDGDILFMQTPISSGKWYPTPTGNFTIWEKIRATRMTGGSGADYYDLPNVPYVMFFYNNDVPQGAGYSLHGAYWHDNFGHPMSHGCVNMRIVDAEKLYSWVTPQTTGYTTLADNTNQGTKVTISGNAP